jgi:hypothetical protein
VDAHGWEPLSRTKGNFSARTTFFKRYVRQIRSDFHVDAPPFKEAVVALKNVCGVLPSQSGKAELVERNTEFGGFDRNHLDEAASQFPGLKPTVGHTSQKYQRSAISKTETLASLGPLHFRRRLVDIVDTRCTAGSP